MAQQHAEAAAEAAQAAAQAAERAKIAAEMPAPVYTPPAPQAGMGDDFYKLYIYGKESGNNPTRWNTEGCVGLGQACPASKLQAVCPNLDYACEDAWFTRYSAKYGGWYGSYLHWLQYKSW